MVNGVPKPFKYFTSGISREWFEQMSPSELVKYSSSIFILWPHRLQLKLKHLGCRIWSSTETYSFKIKTIYFYKTSFSLCKCNFTLLILWKHCNSSTEYSPLKCSFYIRYKKHLNFRLLQQILWFSISTFFFKMFVIVSSNRFQFNSFN